MFQNSFYSRKSKQIKMAANLPSILRAIRMVKIDQTGAKLIVNALRMQNLLNISVTETMAERESFIRFLLRFWDITNSPYLRDKIAHGRKITLSYCLAAVQKVILHWKPSFGELKTLNEITRSDIRDFSLALKEKGLACNTVNNIMIIGTTALKWAYNEGLIKSNPSACLASFTGDKISRDILTEEETEALFTINWRNKRAYIASLLSLTTGLRSGEIRALRKNDIGNGILNISHSWNNLEGLKCPKNGEKRIVPLLPQIQDMLYQLLQETPHKKKDNPYIFYSDNPQKPCSANLFLRNFRFACNNVSKSSRIFIDLKERKLDFHSFRHSFSTRMAERIEENKMARITGHKSEAAARIYQNHITARILLEMKNETALEFKEILPFLQA